jgi:hypothetical protein
MKFLSTILILFTINTSNAATSCNEPEGAYTTRSVVLNQFIFENGNPNWGDWCYELDSSLESNICNNELDQWDNWLSCTEQVFEKSCKKWADKENFAANDKEYNEFILECIKGNYRNLSGDI